MVVSIVAVTVGVTAAPLVAVRSGEGTVPWIVKNDPLKLEFPWRHVLAVIACDAQMLKVYIAQMHHL